MSGGSSRRKGRVYENEVRKWFEAAGHAVVNKNRSGHDGDDCELDALISVEAKNQRAMNLAGWVDQAEAQMHTLLPVVVHKRVGRADIAQHYVTMSAAVFSKLLKLIEGDR